MKRMDVPDWVIGSVIIKVYEDGSLLLDAPKGVDRRRIWLFDKPEVTKEISDSIAKLKDN